MSLSVEFLPLCTNLDGAERVYKMSQSWFKIDLQSGLKFILNVLAWNYTSVNTLLGNLLEQASMSKHGEDENSIDALECEIVSQVINNYFCKL